MNDISIEKMFKAKIHFGHLKEFTSPKMIKYVYTVENKINIINLDLTLKFLTRALNFIEEKIKNEGKILIVGTKKQAKEYVKFYSNKINMPYVNSRWLGGTLTNNEIIRKSINKLSDLEHVIKNKKLTKKELLIAKRRINKLKANLDGIKLLDKLPDALLVIDVGYESIAIKESKALGIPTIGIVDTNNDPDAIDYIIPGNDDSSDSIKLYLQIITNHIKKIRKLNRSI